MRKSISQILKNCGADAKIIKNDSRLSKFKVTDKKLTLEGIVRPNRYSITIKDDSGKVLGSENIQLKNSDDIESRITESLGTLKMLSNVYEDKKLVEEEEEEEFDDLEVEEEDDTIASNLEDGLDMLYDAIMDVGEQAESLTSLGDEDDAEQQNTILSLAGELYACAMDVQEYIEDLQKEAEEADVDESISISKGRKSKYNTKTVINLLSITECMLRGKSDMKDIHKAIKDIKSELIVRGR
jgi:hypothetical protein